MFSVYDNYHNGYIIFLMFLLSRVIFRICILHFGNIPRIDTINFSHYFFALKFHFSHWKFTFNIASVQFRLIKRTGIAKNRRLKMRFLLLGEGISTAAFLVKGMYYREF